MQDVIEVRLVRPLEVAWGGYPVPMTTLRRPDLVKYDPVTRVVHVDTGRGLVLLPVEAGTVDRLALAPSAPAQSQAATQTPVPKASATVSATPVRTGKGTR